MLVNWLSSILCAGSGLMLALNMEFSKYGFVSFLVSHIFFEFAFIKEKNYPLLFNNTVFLVIDIVGIYRWFF